MKIIRLVFIAVILSVSGYAQKTADFGVWGGTSTYFGDIKDVSPLDEINLNMGIYIRYNLNSRVAARASLLSGNFSSHGKIDDVNFDFRKNVQSFSLMGEVNYLRFILGKKETRISPYIMGGIGLMYYPYRVDSVTMLQIRHLNGDHPLFVSNIEIDDPVIALSIPVGFGVKLSIGKQWGIGVEYQVHKLFDDRFDNLDDPFSHVNSSGDPVKYSSFWRNNDWPGYFGFHIMYRFYTETKVCPAYDSKYW